MKHAYFRFIKAATVLIMTLCLGLFLHACVHAKNPYVDGLDEHDIQKMSVGMTIDEVTDYCGAILFEIPVLQYHAHDGGFYVFYFWPTHEVDRPVSPEDNQLRLLAITQKTSETGKEYYILPESVKGEIFTGLKEDENNE